MSQRLAISCFAISAALLLAQPPASAGGLSKDEIIDALKPQPLTRDWRGISVEGGEALAGPPSVDLYVTFAFDSHVVDTDAALTLDNLGRALSDPALADYRFLIAGHTDAKGTEEYNLDLSDRRAASVRRYLLDRYGLGAERIETIGYGEARLLDPTRPEDGVNRRVQVVNISTTVTTVSE